MWNWLQKLVGTKAEPKRARTKRGHYKGDDKSTKNYNEAWASGKAPKKKKKKLNKKR